MRGPTKVRYNWSKCDDLSLIDSRCNGSFKRINTVHTWDVMWYDILLVCAIFHKNIRQSSYQWCVGHSHSHGTVPWRTVENSCNIGCSSRLVLMDCLKVAFLNRIRLNTCCSIVTSTPFARFEIHKVRTDSGVIVNDWLWVDERSHVNILVHLKEDNKYLLFKQRKYGLDKVHNSITNEIDD